MHTLEFVYRVLEATVAYATLICTFYYYYTLLPISAQGRRNREEGGAPHLKVRGHRVCLAPSLFVPEQLMHYSSWTDS